MVSIVAQVWVQLSYENGVITMISNLQPSSSHVDRRKFCIHLRSLSAILDCLKQ